MKLSEHLSRIVNCMRDLIVISKKHQIENYLYYGDGLKRIYEVLGDRLMTKWLGIQCDSKWEGEMLWNKFIDFLEKEMRINQQKALVVSPSTSKQTKHTNQSKTTNYYQNPSQLICHICGKNDHISTKGPGDTQIIQYFSCEVFVNMTPLERFNELRKKNLCSQCLYPGAKQTDGKHKEGKCQRDYACQHQFHDKYKRKVHVLVCEDHKSINEKSTSFRKLQTTLYTSTIFFSNLFKRTQTFISFYL